MKEFKDYFSKSEIVLWSSSVMVIIISFCVFDRINYMTPNGIYKVTVKATDHKKSTGEYNIHVYYIQENNQLVGVTGTTTTVSIAHPKGTLTITNNNPDAGTFDVIVSGVSSPDGVREVKLPTWSNVGRFTTKEEIDVLVDAVREIAEG